MDAITDHHFWIIGKNSLQNELLLNFIQSATGMHGNIALNIDSCLKECEKHPTNSKLLIAECEGGVVKSLCEQVKSFEDRNGCKCTLIFFSAEHKEEIDQTALPNGVQGVFFKSDTPQTIRKGIKAIIGGDIWYSRDALQICIKNNTHPKPGKERRLDFKLTAREHQILAAIASGLSNQQIADDLFLSIHTVKTHIYNIYKKINVKNRLQATLWAANYL